MFDLALTSKNGIPSLLANCSPSFVCTSLVVKSILFPQRIIVVFSIDLMKLIQEETLLNDDFDETSYTTKTIEEFLTYDGINPLYFFFFF